MDQENMPGENVEVVCQMTLTEQQVKQALMNVASEEERLVKLLDGKNCHLWVKWHVYKWDNPDSFCTLTFGVEKENTQDVPDTPQED